MNDEVAMLISRYVEVQCRAVHSLPARFKTQLIIIDGSQYDLSLKDLVSLSKVQKANSNPFGN